MMRGPVASVPVAHLHPDRLICRMLSETPAAAVTDRPSWTRWLVLSALAIVAAHLLDEVAWRLVRIPAVYEKDWGRLLRSMGYLPLWLLMALAWWLQVRDDVLRRTGTWLLALGPTLGGLAAEVLKLLVRRVRPDAEQFGYAFRAFADGPLSNRGMGMPSSHTLVAFAGAFALARLFPRARWVFYLLAAGCGLSRVMATAHYLSDTVVAACVAWAVVALVWQRVRVRPPVTAPDAPSTR
jgi:membrane-associated phospholipid phosphatase